MPAMIERIRQLEDCSATEGGSSPSCWGLQPSTRTVGQAESISSTDSNRLIGGSFCQFFEVPSLAEQQLRELGEKALPEEDFY